MQFGDVECSLCGATTVYQWSVPTFNGDIVSNNFPEGLWGRHGGTRPVCERCFQAHADGRVRTFDFDYAYLFELDLLDGAGI